MGAQRAEQGLQSVAAVAGIKFDFSVRTHWQPVDSQRLLLWAGRFGKQEQFMSALNFKHFEKAESASERETLLAAVKEVGLDCNAATEFLNTDELKDQVWQSYGRTIKEANIHSIPLFVFNVPSAGIVGGPLRVSEQGAKAPYVINGSGDPETFATMFARIRADVAEISRTA